VITFCYIVGHGQLIVDLLSTAGIIEPDHLNQIAIEDAESTSGFPFDCLNQVFEWDASKSVIGCPK